MLGGSWSSGILILMIPMYDISVMIDESIAVVEKRER